MFFPDDAVRVAALSEYFDRQVSDRPLRRPGNLDHRKQSLSDPNANPGSSGRRRRDRRQLSCQPIHLSLDVMSLRHSPLTSSRIVALSFL